MVTIKDIVKKAGGVTPATVSYALNNKGSVSDAMRKKYYPWRRIIPMHTKENGKSGEF